MLCKYCKIIKREHFSVKPFSQSTYPGGKPATAVSSGEVGALQAPPPPPWEGRAIATHKLRLVEFSAFMESTNREESVGSKDEVHTCNYFFYFFFNCLFLCCSTRGISLFTLAGPPLPIRIHCWRPLMCDKSTTNSRRRRAVSRSSTTRARRTPSSLSNSGRISIRTCRTRPVLSTVLQARKFSIISCFTRVF